MLVSECVFPGNSNRVVCRCRSHWGIERDGRREGLGRELLNSWFRWWKTLNAEGVLFLSTAKEFLSRSLCVCVWVRKLRFHVEERREVRRKCFCVCDWPRTFQPVKEAGQSLDKREKCDLWIHLFPLSASLLKPSFSSLSRLLGFSKALHSDDWFYTVIRFKRS